MRAPFLRGGAVGRVRRKIVLPVGVVGVVEGAKPAPIFTTFALIVTGPESVSVPPKLSVSCEPRSTAAATLLPSAVAFVGRPPSAPAERASMRSDR